jgi:hypothetical protein
MREVILHNKRRRWNLFRRRRFVFSIPESWADAGKNATRYLRYVATLEPDQAKVRILQHIFGRTWLRIDAANRVALMEMLAWAELIPDDAVVPVREFEHRGKIYVFPEPKGPNVSGVEFALADDYYKAYVEGDTSALACISACMWREKDEDEDAALERGDFRKPLHNKMQVEQWARELEDAPAEYHIQAFNWFVGLKLHINRVYGPWIFDAVDDEDEDNEKPEQKPTGGPNFGWWGIFIDIADTGAYGTKTQVYQESIHDICIYLVKRRADANQAPEPKTQTPQDEDND